MGIFCKKGSSGFSSSSTAEQVTEGIDGTGATSGIGIETARVLALRGVHVIMAVRNVAAGNDIKESILKNHPSANIDVMELDLSSLASVRKFASDFIARGLPLHILINNAGIMATPFTLTKDNIELQFQTNHIGHFLLTNLLLETMKKTARESGREGRIVVVASDGHKFAYKEGIRFDKINDKSGYTGFGAYGQSKLANILHSNELAIRLKEEGVNITVNSLHPGSIATNIMRHSRLLTTLNKVLGKVLGGFTKTLAQGASTTCYVALHPQLQGVTGEYFEDCNVSKPNAQARDTEMAKKLWDLSMDLSLTK
ncbi:hypothetical protein EZV62_005878 [Acer yangbiense]|uniref:Uncharacterized protein n=1 Tax=Acer yangbiense TaxID=1000413 RepID=A0A5C7INL4_9ROSI|nr:hypothetical protein EZV62_005878 [Acer yangbiense]